MFLQDLGKSEKENSVTNEITIDKQSHDYYRKDYFHGLLNCVDKTNCRLEEQFH